MGDPKTFYDMKLHPMADRITQNHLSLFVDAESANNPSHHYRVYSSNDPATAKRLLELDFQKGPLSECGLNGVSTGTILNILIDHLNRFQQGPFRSRENALVITHLEEALMWLKSREFERAQRGVLGEAKV